MHAYALSFNFREPYQVLLDADIIRDAARFKMKLGSMLENTVHGTIKPMITQCCIRQLYDAEVEPEQKADKENWIEVAKQAERRKCGHHEFEQPLSALECIQSVVDPKGSGTNKHRYVVASQDREIREAMRQIAGVPLIYINRSVMILEPLAAKTEKVREAEEIGKRKAGLRGRPPLAVAEKRKREDDQDDAGEAAVKRKKIKGPKGPNPLSMKKAKKATNPEKVEDGEGAKGRQVSSKVAVEVHDASTGAVDAPDPESAPKKRKRRRKPRGRSEETNGEPPVTLADTSD